MIVALYIVAVCSLLGFGWYVVLDDRRMKAEITRIQSRSDGVTILFRRSTSSNWKHVNPILALNEPGFETDTQFVKLGDGITHWKDLPYVGSVPQANFFMPK